MAPPAADKVAIEQAVVRGSELLKLGKLEDAQKAFRAALLLDGENMRVLALLGLAHFRGNQFEQARAIYEDLVERAPTDASHRLNLGLVYLKLGDGTKAINSLEASRALDPSQGRAVSYLGLAYARAGRYAEAYRSFLLAGQNELATEIESNLTAAERDGIHSQLSRSGHDVKPAVARTSSKDLPAPAIARTASKDLTASALAPATAPSGGAPAAVDDVVTAKAAQADAEPELEFKAERPAHDPAAPRVLSADQHSARQSDSVQFVLPKSAAPVVTDGRSMLSAALDTATPTTAGTAPARASAGATPPIPLSQLATENLVRPDDGDDRFEITSSGALVIRVNGRVLTRLDGVHVTGGDLAYEPSMRRSRGHQTEEKFDHGGTQLHTVSGHGYLIAVPDKRAFTAVMLDDDIFYLREDFVFAFESTLRWENGHIPGMRGKFPVVQFRGDGAVALRSEAQLVRVKLPPSGIVFVDARRLAGWIGRVIPRAVVPPHGGPMGELCVECTGEGVVLVDPSISTTTTTTATATADAPKKPTTIPPPPPPPAAATAPADAPAEAPVEKKAVDWMADDFDSGAGRDEI